MTSTIHIILPPAERAEERPRRDCCTKALAQSHWSYLSRCWMRHAAFFIQENRERGGAKQVFSLN